MATSQPQLDPTIKRQSAFAQISRGAKERTNRKTLPQVERRKLYLLKARRYEQYWVEFGMRVD